MEAYINIETPQNFCQFWNINRTKSAFHATELAYQNESCLVEFGFQKVIGCVSLACLCATSGKGEVNNNEEV